MWHKNISRSDPIPKTIIPGNETQELLFTIPALYPLVHGHHVANPIHSVGGTVIAQETKFKQAKTLSASRDTQIMSYLYKLLGLVRLPYYQKYCIMVEEFS